MSLELAKEIKRQLTYNLPVVWSWGANSWRALPADIGGVYGGLQFKVNGRKFKGTVKILLMASDTYTIYLNNEKRFDDIYCDELLGCIDELVET